MVSSAALAQSTFEASGAYNVGGTTNGVNGGFTLPAASGFVVGHDDHPAAGRFDPSASVEAVSQGDGHFGGSAVTAQSYGSTIHLASDVHMVYRDAIVNTNGMAQQASFAININSLAFAFDRGSESGTNRVSFAANVYVDGSAAPLWSSTFDYDDGRAYYTGPATFRQSGADLGLAAQLPMSCPWGIPDGQCSFFPGGFGITNYSTSVALGAVASGQTLGIRYEVDLATETDMYGGDASVKFNDPSALMSNATAGHLAFDAPSDSGATPMAAVPEPETYAMLAAGLGLMATARRRRNR